MPGTLRERASFCKICRENIGDPSEADLAKLAQIERERGYEIMFFCEQCNAAFVAWHRAVFGEDPVPALVIGGETLH